MNLQEASSYLIEQLQTIYDKHESYAIIDLLLEHITKMSKTDRAMNQDSVIPCSMLELTSMIDQLLKHKPIQYVLGEAWFYGNRFTVNGSVLIPRPETEELIAWIISDLRKNQITVSKILEIGTGSGCIPITLKKHLKETEVTALEVCSEAIYVAIENAYNLNTEINFQLIDFLDENKWKELGKYDIIVSNPPYIKSSEAKTMSQHVLDYEPHKALFVPDDDGLLFYRKIADFALTHLNSYGVVYLEINQQLGKETSDLFFQKGFTVELKKDMSGNERMIKAILKL